MFSSTFYSLQPKYYIYLEGFDQSHFHPSHIIATDPRARAGPSATAFFLLHSFRNAGRKRVGCLLPIQDYPRPRAMAHCSEEKGRKIANQNRPSVIYLPLPKAAVISEYRTRTIAAPTVRRALAPAPLKRAVVPSSFMILAKQSAVPL